MTEHMKHLKPFSLMHACKKRRETEQKLRLAIAEQHIGEELLDIAKKTPMKVFICDSEVQECYLGGNDMLWWETCPTKVVFHPKNMEFAGGGYCNSKVGPGRKVSPCYLWGNYKALCELLNAATREETPDPEEIGYFNKDEYDIESNIYEDLAEDFDIHWVLARASGEVRKANLNLNWTMVIPEKLQERQLGLLHSTTGSGQRESFEITW
ncbi:hypothetical protein BDZ91DRAFT_769131 [Kalaharituber pfeilii]|nr:hypothetical protein BDZ91DRAFT_769131 [Kalaharituber pfeilii]